MKLIHERTGAFEDNSETCRYVDDLQFVTSVIVKARTLEDLELPSELLN
jgi:hypothetical protein